MKKYLSKVVVILLIFGTSSILYAQKTLSLDEAITLAMDGNKVLKIQKLQELKARQLVKESRGEYLPNIGFSGSVSKYFDRQNIFLPGSFAGTEKAVQEVGVGGLQQYNGVVLLHQRLYSKKTNEAFKATLVEEKIEKERTADLESQLIHEVTRSYYQVLLLQNQLVLLQKSLTRNERALKDAKSLFVQGKGLKTDTLSSYIAVENLKTSVTYQKSTIDISKYELLQLIGLNDTEDINLTDSLSFIENDEEIGITDDEIVVEELNRHDLLIQKLNVELEQKNLSAAKAARMPELSLVGQYQLQSQSDDAKFNNQTWHSTSFVGATISIPIFNGGRTSSKIKQGQIKLEQEKIRMDDLQNAVKLELSTIINNWNHARNQYETQKKTVEAAEVNYAMHHQRYSNGIGSKLEVTDAELALTQSQINLLQAIYNLKINKSELQRAMGRLSV